MLHRLLPLLAWVLCGTAQAAEPPLFELSAAPAWKGWSRPGRTTEVDIRLGGSAPAQLTIELKAGRQSVRSEIELQPGRPQRIQLPIGAAQQFELTVAAQVGPSLRRSVDLALSEAPLLASVTGGAGSVELEGFHTLALAPDDLPRNAAAYSSIDALVLDAVSLAALDTRQLAALLDHAGGCGRIVVLGAEPRLRRMLDAASGCAGRSLMHAQTLAQARELLQASLAASLPVAVTGEAGLGQLAGADHRVWTYVVVAVAAYFALAVLVLVFLPALPVLLLTSAVAALALFAWLHLMPAPSRMLVWSEGESGIELARYQAWQRFPGRLRERVRVAIAPQVASTAQACDPGLSTQLDYDAAAGRLIHAEFETRLFRQVTLCYRGSFPMTRALELQARGPGQHEVRNAGFQAWPAGRLLMAGRVHELQALAPGAVQMLADQAGRPPTDTAARTAITRGPVQGAAALWQLELAGVVDAPLESKGWLLVSVPSR